MHICRTFATFSPFKDKITHSSLLVWAGVALVALVWAGVALVALVWAVMAQAAVVKGRPL